MWRVIIFLRFDLTQGREMFNDVGYKRLFLWFPIEVFISLFHCRLSDWQVLALWVGPAYLNSDLKKRIDGLRYFCGFCDSDIFKVTVSLNPLALHYKLKWIRVITMQNYLDLIETCRALQIERHSCPNKESRSAKPPWMRAHSKECELRRILNGKLSLECSFFRESACN